MAECPNCGKAMSVSRNRCYFCNGRPKTGEVRPCKSCGKEFYVPGWVMRDTARQSGTFCSRACKGVAMALKTPPWAKPNELTRHAAGYLLAWAPGHPRAKKEGRVLHHILVAEEMLGRSLKADEHVHHKNLKRDDNRPENLVVLNKREHHQLHAALMREKRKQQRDASGALASGVHLSP